MIRRIDHIGIAVRDLDKAVALYRDTLGLKSLGLETVESEGVRVALLEVGESRIELLTPLKPGEGPIGKFLEARGEGVHHVCLGVEGIGKSIAALTEVGLPFVGAAPRLGAHGCMVAFLHPKATCGVLIELSERPSP
ncbi:MAG: methylmalonyl-CoA epimerase [Deltaproteobacteria bacterium]|nr:methylmalonyl-CoA epimerase [Deltaproteobacteria bacterium]